MTTKIQNPRSKIPVCLPLLTLLALWLWPAPAQAQARMVQFSVVNTSTTVPKQITNAVTYCTSFTIEGKASQQGAANAGTLYVGPFATDGLNGYPILSGGLYVYSDPKGRTIDLSTIYIDVTSANDGVCVTYW